MERLFNYFRSIVDYALKEKRALTLLETVMAIGLLTILILSFSGVMLTGQLAAHSAKEQTIGLNLAQAKMEEILAGKLDSARAGSGSFEHFPNYRYQFEIERYHANTSLWAVRVLVFRVQEDRSRNEVALFTLKRGAGS